MSGQRAICPFGPFASFGSVAATVALLMTAAACRQSPIAAFARTLDQAASWAASVELGDDMRTAGRVPRVYIDDLLQHGAADVSALHKKLSEAEGVAPMARSEASTLCGRLTLLLEDARRSDARPDRRQLRAIETRLRDLAQTVRAGGTSPTVGASP